MLAGRRSLAYNPLSPTWNALDVQASVQSRAARARRDESPSRRSGGRRWRPRATTGTTLGTKVGQRLAVVPDGGVASPWPTWLVAVAVAAAYAAGALVAYQAFDAISVVVLFLPAGVTLSALVLCPRRQWPWILGVAALAEITVDVMHGGATLVASLGFALANTAEPFVGAVLLRRNAGRLVDLLRRRDLVAFLVCCVFAGPLVGGLVGATTISLSRHRPWIGEFAPFWACDALGVLTVGGALLTLRHLNPITRRKISVLLLAVLATLVVTAAGFWPSRAVLFYLPIPLLFWFAFRLPVAVMLTSGLAMTISANALTSAERGPWAGSASTPQLATATLQLFLGLTVISAWFLAVGVAERDRARSATSAERATRQQIQGLQAVTAQLAKAATADDVAETVAAQGVTLIATHGTVAVVSADRRSVAVRGTPGWQTDLEVRYRQIPMTAATPLTDVIRTGDGITDQSHAAIAARFPAMAEDYATLGIGSSLCVPIIDGDTEALGALGFGFAREYAVDADTVAFAETLASLTAQALRRARQYDMEREAAHQLQSKADELNQALREQHALQRQLTYRALHDPLTGLANREVLAERLESSLARRDSRTPPALLLLDVDDFKAVNDTYGHSVGDSVLVEVAHRLARVAPKGALTVRLGGDEFAVLVDHGSPDQAHGWAEQLRRCLIRPVDVDGQHLPISASVGVLLADEAEHSTPIAALRDADLALYAAKDGGRDRVVLFQPALRRVRLERTAMATGLRHADLDTEFGVVYQPIVAMTDGQPVWVEALARWTRPNGRQVPPDMFIPLAEETGRIHTLGAWVLRHALRAMTPRVGTQNGGFSLSVNVSNRQLERHTFADQVLSELTAANVPASALILELTESTLVNLSRARGSAVTQLDRLRGHGIRIALDDFGTGYSSLSTIARLPVDIVKLDRSFTQDTTRHARNTGREFLLAVLRLAESLDLVTVAEGVETEQQADLLRDLGCPLGQGNLFAAPLTVNALDALLAGTATSRTP